MVPRAGAEGKCFRAFCIAIFLHWNLENSATSLSQAHTFFSVLTIFVFSGSMYIIMTFAPSSRRVDTFPRKSSFLVKSGHKLNFDNIHGNGHSYLIKFDVYDFLLNSIIWFIVILEHQNQLWWCIVLFSDVPTVPFLTLVKPFYAYWLHNQQKLNPTYIIIKADEHWETDKKKKQCIK